MEEEVAKKKADLEAKEAADEAKKAKEDEEEEETKPEVFRSAEREEEDKKIFNQKVDVLAAEAEVNKKKALAKEAAKKKAAEDRKEQDKKDFEDEVKASSELRKKAAISKGDVGDDAPTADETEAATKAKVAKMKFPSGIETVKDEKVAKAQADLDKTTPEYKEELNMKDKEDKAELAVKVGELQEKQAKLDASAKAHGLTKDEVWSANMPGQYLAQAKAKAAVKEAEEEESESEEEEEEEEENKNADDDDEEDDSSDDDDDTQVKSENLAKKGAAKKQGAKKQGKAPKKAKKQH